MQTTTYIDEPQLDQRIARIVRGLTTFDPWMAPKDIANYARLSKDHILRTLRAGDIEHVGEGKMMRARQSAVDAWLARKTGARQ